MHTANAPEQTPDREEIINKILEGLNDEQRAAVCAEAGNTLVLAGAGSGKTRVLIHRIAWLVHVLQYSPHAVLAVTFTNKAANEMRGRLQTLLGFSVSQMWVGTFHGLAHRLLRQHHEMARLPKHFQILDSDDQLRVIKRIMKENNLDEKAWPPKQAQWYINGCKDKAQRPQDIIGKDLFEQTMQMIYAAYQTTCDRAGMVDFAELLLRSYELWQHNPELLQHYQQRFQHILVDEFQDTNHTQYLWLRLLAGKNSSTFAVGDDDQSIYGWRGADVTNIQHFKQDFSNTIMVRLEQNYRSSGTILEAANALIDHNTGRLGKKLWTAGEKGEQIALYEAFNEYDEARFVVARIQAWVEAGGTYTQCAVLYRSNAQSRVIETSLSQANMPYRVYGGLRFYARAEIKDASAYLRLIANENDDSAFERVVNMPPRGIGARSIDIVRNVARAGGLSLWQATEQAILSKALSTRAGNAILQFQTLILDLRKAVQSLSLPSLTEQVIERSGLKTHFKEKGKKNEKELIRLENLDELISATQPYFSEDIVGINQLTLFLSDTALDAGEESSSTPDESVQLMTLHTAKGLEFPQVFMCGLEEDLFPNRRALQDDGLEEERRLCYVGITRAMQQLTISYAQNRRLHGSDQYPMPSRFIREIPLKLLENVRLNTKQNSQQYTQQPPVANQQQHSFYIGQAIMHTKFGEGVVLELEGAGEFERAQVNFRTVGAKWLVLSYANLQAI